ncbi:MAG: hypothetical protein Kow0059_15540 [Candidatus Sumerlaeia bacterium]
MGPRKSHPPVLALMLFVPMWILAGGAPTAAPQPAAADSPAESKPDDKVRLIIRTDDIGFCHGVNAAIERILGSGQVTAVSVIVNTPWLPEAVEILNRHPEVSVGVHLCLNSEWREYRWGPVLGADRVPSLVDQFGYFHGSRAALMRGRPKPEEVEQELRAQVDRAIEMGLPVSYVDYHMGAAMGAREFQQAVERIARDYQIGISRYFGEQDTQSVYKTPPAGKVEDAVRILDSLTTPGLYLMVVHPGSDTPEMAAMSDLNPGGLTNMSAHRQAEADMLCDPRFREALERRGIELVGYKQLDLTMMKRPFEAPPYEEAVEAAITAQPPNPYGMFEKKR